VRLIVWVTLLEITIALLLRAVGVPRTRRCIAMLRRMTSFLIDASQSQVLWALNAIAYRLDFASNCLVRAFAAEVVLSTGRDPVRVTIGIRRVGKRLEGHAWLERNGSVIVGELVSAHSRSVQSSFTAMLSWDTGPSPQ
jgi:hypothetical protein